LDKQPQSDSSKPHSRLEDEVLAVLAAFVDDSSPLLGQVLALGSIAAFVWLYVRGFRGPDRNSTKSWRGRDIDFSPSSRPDWLNRRFGGPKRPRR
jgi:hypothetical protein